MRSRYLSATSISWSENPYRASRFHRPSSTSFWQVKVSSTDAYSLERCDVPESSPRESTYLKQRVKVLSGISSKLGGLGDLGASELRTGRVISRQQRIRPRTEDESSPARGKQGFMCRNTCSVGALLMPPSAHCRHPKCSELKKTWYIKRCAQG